MQAKKVIYSGVILLLIIAAMFVSNLLENSKEKKTFAPFFPNFADKAGKIVLTQGEESVIISKNDKNWFVALSAIPDLQYPADSVKVMSVIQKIAEMKQDNFVSKNSDNFALYGLEGDSVYSVQIFDTTDKQVGDFLLGRRSENWRFNYFKIAGKSEVFMVGGGIGYAFNSDINEWRARKLFDFNPNDVVEITAVENGTTNSVNKDSAGVWTFADGSAANADSITNYILEFVNLDANDWDYSYSIPDEISGLTENATQYTLTSKDGSKITLTVGNIDGDRPRFFVRYNNNPQIAFVLRSQILRLKFQ